MADCAAAKRRIGQDKYRKLFNLLRASFAIKYRKEDGIPAQVVDGLYLGSIGAALNKEVLQERGITHVVSALAKFQPPHTDAFEYLTLEVEDAPTEQLTRYFPRTNTFIDEAIRSGGKVLVHCFAGISRSTTVVLGYLVAHRGMQVLEALALVQSARPRAAPNTGFMTQLLAYEKLVRKIAAPAEAGTEEGRPEGAAAQARGDTGARAEASTGAGAAVVGACEPTEGQPVEGVGGAEEE